MAIVEAIRVRIREEVEPAAFEILSFDGPAAVREIGDELVEPAFTASYNRPPSEATLSDDDGNPSEDVSATPEAFASSNTYVKTTPNEGVTFTLEAGDVAGEDSEEIAVAWRARTWVGWTTDPGPYDEAKILALNELASPIQANALFDATLAPTNAPGGAYLVCAYHDVFNGAVPTDFEIGSFGNGDVTEVQTGEPITIPGGGTAPYSIARSDFAIEAPGGIRFARES